jgi:hypothetical protein
VVDDYEFDPLQFQPYLPGVFGGLTTLLIDVHEADTQSTILNGLSAVIAYAGKQVNAGSSRRLGERGQCRIAS